MGIEGLLQALKPVRAKKHIKSFEGLKAAIDASTWLYKGTYSCASQLAQGKKTNAYLKYTLKMIRLLRTYRIKPILVFDGLLLPLKSNTIDQRKADKAKNKAEGDKLWSQGQLDEANALYARSISIKKSMVFTLIDILNAIHVQYVVAPYEADAQIAYLCKQKIADFAITEDSDLLAYGCQNIVFKLDHDGNCEHVSLESLRDGSFEGLLEDDFVNSLLDMPEDKVIELCIVAGCDYLQNIPGFGIKKAMKMMARLTLDEALSRIRYNKQYMGKIPEGYRDKIKKIKYQFLCGRVIDTETYKMTTLRPFPGAVKAQDIEGIGAVFKEEIVEKYAKGFYNYKKQEERKGLSKEEAIMLLTDITGYNKDAKKNTTENKSDKVENEAEHINKEITGNPIEEIKSNDKHSEEKKVTVEESKEENIADLEELNKYESKAEEENFETKKRLYLDLVQDEAEAAEIEPAKKVKKYND